MGTLNIETGWPTTIKTYSTEKIAAKKAEHLSKSCKHLNARIVPAGNGRFTIVFFAFQDMQDALWIARQGFMAYS